MVEEGWCGNAAKGSARDAHGGSPCVTVSVTVSLRHKSLQQKESNSFFKEGKEPGLLGPLIGPLIGPLSGPLSGLTTLIGLTCQRVRWPWYSLLDAFQILTSVYDRSDSVWS